MADDAKTRLRERTQAEATSLELMKQVAQLRKQREQLIELNGQACVRAEQAEDRAEKAERENTRLKEMMGEARALAESWRDMATSLARQHGGTYGSCQDLPWEFTTKET